MKLLAEGCSRQIRGWADSLQNSEIEGQRHLNDRSCGNWEKKQEAEKHTKAFKEMERAMIAKLSKDDPARRLWEYRNGPAGESQI